MKVIVDENVSYGLVAELRSLNCQVIAIAEKKYAGMRDEDVYNLTVREDAILVTRNYHFTNSLRFPAERTAGIVYIRLGNLISAEEIQIVKKFLVNCNLKQIRGKLVTLYRDALKIR